MSKITESPRNRALLAVASYVLLTISVALLSGFISDLAASNGAKTLLAICGPVLALRTHMSIFLWVPLSIPLIGLLVIGAIYMKTRLLVAVVFVLSWFAIGWYLKDLF